MSARMRRLVVAGETFLWRVHHRHRPPACAEVFTAYRDGRPRFPLRVLFPEGPLGGREPIERAGIVVDAAGAWANLNEPGTARRVIELAIRAGWTAARALEVADGYTLLRGGPV